MITSKDNEKLKLIRRLAERKHREREGLLVAEGEDLVDAAAAAGAEPELILRAGEDVEAELLASVSSLGSGTRVIGVYRHPAWAPVGRRCVYLHGLGDPRNVGAVLRSTHALLEATVLLGPGCADPFSPLAVRASMGSVFAQPLARGELAATPRPRVAMLAHGTSELPPPGEPATGAGRGAPLEPGAVATLCLGAEREGLPAAFAEECDARWTIPLRAGGAESLNVAAAAAIALWRIACERGAAAPGDPPDASAAAAAAGEPEVRR